MPALVPFTSNYSDVSTYEGYQYEFRCMRCGNGFRSRFRHSVTGFGGRLAALGGNLLGGEIGNRIQDFGMLAEWNRSGTSGTTHDRRLAEASQDVAEEFTQCGRCGGWACRAMCWNPSARCCRTCADAMPAATGACSVCGAPGDGRFCGGCGSPMAARHCRGCGADVAGGRFCMACGTPVG